MLIVKYGSKFKKDYKLMEKRGLNMDLLHEIVKKLANNEPLPDKNRDHNLTGNYKRVQRMSYTTRLAFNLYY